MEVNVKCQVLTKGTITNISYNRQQDIISLISQGSDTTNFYIANQDLQLFQCINQGETKPPGLVYHAWNMQGNLLALAKTKVEVWNFQNGKFSPNQVFNEGFLQITNITWSSDNVTYLCNGLVSRDVPLMINIRNVETKQLRQIQVEDIVVSANFDPFGKYIVVLTKKNVVEFYDLRNLKKCHAIDMARTKNDFPTLQEHRIIDWSPDYGYIAVPNLNDSKISSAIIFDRNRNFIIKQILTGHQTPISCLKFSPVIYQYHNQHCFLLGTGDTSGCLAIWRISNSKQAKQAYNQPLKIFSSPLTAEQTIQNFFWSSDGSKLFVNVLKKYLLCIQIRLDYSRSPQIKISRKINTNEKLELIKSIYGAYKDSQISGKRLEVFGQTSEILMLLQREEQQKIKFQLPIIQNKFKQTNTQKQPMVKTKQETIMRPGGKKSIKPSVLVPESSITNLQRQKSEERQGINTTNLQGNNSIIFNAPLPIVKLPTLMNPPKKSYQLNPSITLETFKLNFSRILEVKTMNKMEQTVYKKHQTFKKQINHLSISKNQLLIVCDRKLYIFNWYLQPQQLPFYIGDISGFTTNQRGYIYILQTNGLLRGLNLENKEFKVETSISFLFLESRESNITEKVIDKYPFSEYEVNQDGYLIVEIKESCEKYYYDYSENRWVLIEFNAGIYSEGHSLRISQSEKQTSQSFFSRNLKPGQFENIIKTQNFQPIQQLQFELLYYRNNMKQINDPVTSTIKFKEILLKLLIELKNRKMDDLLRYKIQQYFYNRASKEYIGEQNCQEMWGKVKQIGGNILEEFLMMEHDPK